MRCLAAFVFVTLLGGQQADPSQDLAAAHTAEQSGNLASAEAIYAKLVAAAPDAALYQRLGLVRHLQNKFSKAADAFVQAVKIDPSLWSSHLFLGIDYYRMNRFDDADEHLQIANRLHPAEPEILFWSGATQIARRDYMHGFQTLEQLLKRDPRNAEALRLLAESYANYGTTLLDQVAEQFPESTAGLIVQGKAYEFEGNYAAALDQYRAAQAHEPHRAGLQEAIDRAEELLKSSRHTQ